MAAEAIAIAPGTHLGLRITSRVMDLVTAERMEFINITDRINEMVRYSGISSGIVQVQVLHTTASVFITEWQDALLEDTRAYLCSAVDRNDPWRHNDPRYSDCERRNANSHLRGMMLGQSVNLQVRDGRVLLGTWQSIVLGEFDGPRTRTVSVQIFGI